MALIADLVDNVKRMSDEPQRDNGGDRDHEGDGQQRENEPSEDNSEQANGG